MKRIYKAHILYTKEPNRFEVLENGYIAVVDGCVAGVASSLSDLHVHNAEVVDFGDRLLIPAMNDMHVHAPRSAASAVPPSRTSIRQAPSRPQDSMPPESWHTAATLRRFRTAVAASLSAAAMQAGQGTAVSLA